MIPMSFFYVIKIVEYFKTNKKQPAKLVNKAQDNKLTYDIPYKVSPYKIIWIHMFALLVAFYFILFLVEIVTTTPQKGFGGPLPQWGGRLIFMPVSGFMCSWIFMSMSDTLYCFYPKDFKKPYTKARRSTMAVIFILIGMLLPWLESIVSHFN